MPPYFGLTFAVMLVSILPFLLGGALVRNAVLEGGRHGWFDSLLETDGALLGMAILLVWYPVLVVQRRLSWWPYAILLVGIGGFAGPMVYWAWWYEQLPW